AEDGIRDFHVTGVQTCALPISYSQSDIFNFPNINNVSFFSDRKSLEKIAAIPKDNGNQTHYNLLKAYVQQFGVETFSRNTNMLWQLAKLSEKFGPPGEEVLLYKLVLKHHQQDIDGRQVRQEYDSLTKYQSDYYVPLKYYYELVEYRKEIDTLRPPQGVLLNMGIQVNSPKADY